LYPITIGTRYMLKKRVTIVCVAGVAVGVMALTVVLSVMNGFLRDIKAHIRGTLTDLVVESHAGSFDYKDRIEQIRKLEHVVACAPFVEGMAIAKFGIAKQPVQFRGVIPEQQKLVSEWDGQPGQKRNRFLVGRTIDTVLNETHRGKPVLFGGQEMFRLMAKGSKVDPQADPDENFLPFEASPLLGADDVERPLCAKLVQASEQTTPCPGQRIWQLMPPLVQTAVQSLASGKQVTRTTKFVVVNGLNDVIQNPVLYDRETFKGIELPVECRELLKRDERDDGETWKLNRLLLEAAYPNEIKALRLQMIVLATVTSSFGRSVRGFRLAGTFKTGMYEFDRSCVYISLKEAQELSGMGDTVTGISVRLDDYANAEIVREQIVSLLGPAFKTVTWEEERATFITAVEVERRVMGIILFFILVVAGFGILSILTMVVMEKAKDIGTLRAIGATRAGIIGIFTFLGAAIGVIGSAVGLGAGIVILKTMNRLEDWIYLQFDWRVFPQDVYYLDHIPHQISPGGLALFVAGAIFTSFVASLYPAWRAANVDPIQSLRYE